MKIQKEIKPQKPYWQKIIDKEIKKSINRILKEKNEQKEKQER